MSSKKTNFEEWNLVCEILDGNSDKYKILVDRYSSMVFHIVRRFLKDEDEVKELSQQIFIKTYEKLDSFHGTSKFSTWLYRIAYNHCYDHVKAIRFQDVRLNDLNYNELNFYEDKNVTPHLRMEKKEWAERLKSALENLSTDYSMPFIMKYRDGMSYKSISEETGVSVSALKVRVHRARKELKGMLEKEI